MTLSAALLERVTVACASAANVADKAQGKSMVGWIVNGTSRIGTTIAFPMFLGNPDTSPLLDKVADALTSRSMTRVDANLPPRVAVKSGTFKYPFDWAVKP